jgi:hypothetical protein
MCRLSRDGMAAWDCFLDMRGRRVFEEMPARLWLFWGLCDL